MSSPLKPQERSTRVLGDDTKKTKGKNFHISAILENDLGIKRGKNLRNRHFKLNLKQ